MVRGCAGKQVTDQEQAQNKPQTAEKLARFCTCEGQQNSSEGHNNETGDTTMTVSLTLDLDSNVEAILETMQDDIDNGEYDACLAWLEQAKAVVERIQSAAASMQVGGLA